MTCKFSFNWSTWPFVEIVGDPIIAELQSISPQLRSDLRSWCGQMLENYDELRGFKDGQIQEKLNVEYENLCLRLEAEGVHFTKDIWWY